MKILQVFNSRISKHGSFEDFMLELTREAKRKGTSIAFVFPEIRTNEVQKELEARGARVYVINSKWSSLSYVKDLIGVCFSDEGLLRRRFAPPRNDKEDKMGLLRFTRNDERGKMGLLRRRFPRLRSGRVARPRNDGLVRNDNLADFHFCYSFNFVFVFLILKILGVKIVYHYHGEIIPIENLRFVNRHFSKLRLLTLFADKIVCVSEVNKRFLEALNIRKRVDVVYNGVNIENFKNIDSKRSFKKEMNFTREPALNHEGFRTVQGFAPRRNPVIEEATAMKPRSFTNGELIVTSIASLIPRKGIDILIKAAKDVIDVLPNARFILIGGGDKEPYQRMAEDLGIADKIVFTGLIKEYPYYILKDTDLFVSASYAESFGLSIAEAQLLGIPVVATKVGGVPEVVNDGKGGVLVPAGDSKRMAKEIIRLLRDEELRRDLGNFGKKWVTERFNLEDRVEELINVYAN